MPALGKPQHERYCVLRGQGLPKPKAYRVAYGLADGIPDDNARACANRLEKKPTIIARIHELCAPTNIPLTPSHKSQTKTIQTSETESIALHKIDRTWVLQRFVHEALHADNALARVRCVENIGKMIGVSELSTKTVRNITLPSEMTTEQLREALQAAHDSGFAAGQHAVEPAQLEAGSATGDSTVPNQTLDPVETEVK